MKRGEKNKKEGKKTRFIEHAEEREFQIDSSQTRTPGWKPWTFRISESAVKLTKARAEPFFPPFLTSGPPSVSIHKRSSVRCSSFFFLLSLFQRMTISWPKFSSSKDQTMRSQSQKSHPFNNFALNFYSQIHGDPSPLSPWMFVLKSINYLLSVMVYLFSQLFVLYSQ